VILIANLPQITGDGKNFANAVQKALNAVSGIDSSSVQQVTKLGTQEKWRYGESDNSIIDLIVSWHHSSDIYDNAEVYIKKNNSTVEESVVSSDLNALVDDIQTDWTLVGSGEENYYIRNVAVGSTYVVKVVAVNKPNTQADFLTAPTYSYYVTGVTYFPATPSNMQVVFDKDGISASWDAIDDSLNFELYELRGDTNVGEENKLYDTVKVSRSIFTITKPTARSGNIYLYSKDINGNYSEPFIYTYTKAYPPKPVNITTDTLFQGFKITFDPIPDNCMGATIDVNGVLFYVTTNSFTYHVAFGSFIIKIAYKDVFGNGIWSDDVLKEIIGEIPKELLNAGSDGLTKISDIIDKVINSVDIPTFNSNMDSIFGGLNVDTISDCPFTVIKRIQETQTGFSQQVAQLAIVDGVDEARFNQLTANLNTNLNDLADPASFPYLAISQLKQTTNAISATLLQNNADLTSDIAVLNIKADQISSNVVTLNDKVVTNASTITQRADLIEAKLGSSPSAEGQFQAIASLKMTADTIDQRVTTVNTNLGIKIDGANSSIVQFVKDLNLPASESPFSSISQGLSDINLKVSKGDVINQINVDTSGILINGKYLKITGDTLFQGTGIFQKLMANGDKVIGTQIAGDTITTYNILANTITGSDIAGNTITGTNIAGGTITGDNITANVSLDAPRISGGTIIGGTVIGGRVQNWANTAYMDSDANIHGSSISGAYISGGNIYGTTINGVTINGSNINGDCISAGTVTVDRLNINVKPVVVTGSATTFSRGTTGDFYIPIPDGFSYYQCGFYCAIIANSMGDNPTISLNGNCITKSNSNTNTTVQYLVIATRF